jgi:hypothetical protein
MSVGSSANPSVTVPSSEEISAQIERILSSPSFRGSAPVKRLLRYLAKYAMEHPGEAVKEYELATEGLGRNDEFDPRVDAVVRLTASRLRAKLAEYYLHEGKDDPVLVDIPKGTYVVVSSHRKAATGAGIGGENAETQPVAGAFHWRNTWVGPLGLAAVLGALCALLVWQNLHLRSQVVAAAGTASGHAEYFWKNLFPNGKPVSLVTSDANLLALSNFINRTASLDEYRAPGYPLNLIHQRAANPAVERLMSEQMTTFLTTNHDSMGVASIAGVLDRYRIPFNVVYARDARLEPDSEDNIVLLGSRQANPWVELFDHKVNFVYEWDAQQRKGVLRNRSPKSGEKEVYAAKPGKPKTYATVVYASGPNGKGSVLMFGGTDETAIEVGTHFMTDEASLASLHAALGIDPGRPLPHFELLLSARELTDIPYNLEIVACRVSEH